MTHGTLDDDRVVIDSNSSGVRILPIACRFVRCVLRPSVNGRRPLRDKTHLADSMTKIVQIDTKAFMTAVYL